MSVEETPEFQKALQEACQRQSKEYLYGPGSKPTEEALARAERIIKDVKIRNEITSNAHAREITENLRRIHSAEGGVVCPQCGETDSHGNRSNGKPFCFKCNLVMISKEKARKWVKPQPPKRFPRTFNEPDGVCKK